MAAKYYMDVHVPAAITAGLRRRGIDVLTSQEDDTREVDDEVLLARASELSRRRTKIPLPRCKGFCG